MFKRTLVLLVLLTMLSGCAVVDTAKDVFGAIGSKISGIFSGSSSDTDAKCESQKALATKRVLLRTFRGDLPLVVEVADSQEEREIGLMCRETLTLGTGMFFVFADELPRNFWMKDTLIPLDIIYYSSKKKVVSIVEGMVPCSPQNTNELCPLYPSGAAAMYAIEAPAGFVQANGIQVGDELVLD